MNLTVGIFNVISEVFNMLIGVIVSVYILYSKEIFARQCKKAVYALFRADRANMLPSAFLLFFLCFTLNL